MSAPEFEMIDEVFRPLAVGRPGSFDLTDDAALLLPPAGETLVTCVDTVIDGVHFLPGTRPQDVAAKGLRVNLSDIAAMGARPLSYMLALSLPKSADRRWVEAFAGGLAAEQALFDIYLLGGDTTGTPGPLTLSVTLFGSLPAGHSPLVRAGAKAGDLVFVSGSIGDGGLGLLAAGEGLPGLREEDEAALRRRYERPEPRLALGQALLRGGLANAAMDISDGLLQDLGHIARRSGLGARIGRDTVPLSPAAAAALSLDEGYWSAILGGGDDYELLFTVPPAKAGEVKACAAALGVAVTEVGDMVPGEGVSLVDGDGKALDIVKGGWSHL
jgi:thiamine-monophosphate kinase